MKNNTNTPATPTVTPVSELIKAAKEQNGTDAKQPTTYPVQTPEKDHHDPTSAPAQTPKVEPVTEQTPAIVVSKSEAIQPARSRADEIAFQVEKSRKLQLTHTQLVNLNTKRDELKQFSYTVDQSEDSRFGRLVIYDDNNREFVCKNHGLAALVVEYLKGLFSEKISEKENELLAIAKQ